MFNYNALQLKINLIKVNIVCLIIFLNSSKPEVCYPWGYARSEKGVFKSQIFMKIFYLGVCNNQKDENADLIQSD